MSTPPQMRRAEKLMSHEDVHETLLNGYCGRLATFGKDGYPYCVPLLYVWQHGEVCLHNAKAVGHLRANVDHNPNVCFEIDQPGEVFPYGRFECDTSIAYRSVILFGKIRVVESSEAKQGFFEALMEKYAKSSWGRTKSFFTRLDQITLYAITVERMTGKQIPLPAMSEQWPSLDRTKTPNARQNNSN